ncbi:MAG TPA: HAD-IA family hydrolase [Bryobacteraceae bacterium]|nr:HAD-IA family hydrolase [Bryobacteraceae bacterium]
MSQTRFRILYSDIGGVLGTNGWGEEARENICRQFQLDSEEIGSRHRLMFDSYERGYLTFDDYLRHVFFGSDRDFTIEQLREAAYSQSVAWPENIDFLKRVKEKNNLKLALISNEGSGITEHRVGKFKLRELADFMVISHFVHMRKPDPEIWRLALNLAQAQVTESIYIDDRPMFANMAGELGFAAIRHVSLEQTAGQLRRLGLQVML